LQKAHIHLNVFALSQRLHNFYQLLDAPLNKAISVSIISAFIVTNGQEDSLFCLFVLIAIHGVSFARACLAIAKDGRVESVNNVLDHVVNL
jgi:hypothetical protein